MELKVIEIYSRILNDKEIEYYLKKGYIVKFDYVDKTTLIIEKS